MACSRCWNGGAGAALVARSGVLADARVRAALGELSGRFTDQTMRRLNYAGGREASGGAGGAAEFLASAGLR